MLKARMNDAVELFASCLPNSLFESNGSLALPSLTGGSNAFLALSLAARPTPRVVIALTEGLPSADRLYDDLTLLTNSSDISPSACGVR